MNCLATFPERKIKLAGACSALLSFTKTALIEVVREMAFLFWRRSWDETRATEKTFGLANLKSAQILESRGRQLRRPLALDPTALTWLWWFWLATGKSNLFEPGARVIVHQLKKPSRFCSISFLFI